MTELVINFELDGLHFWPNAPEQYKEFGQPHRHLFKFICWYAINNSNDPARRDKELWELRQETISKIATYIPLIKGVYNFGSMSCEGMADLLKSQMNFSRVFVGEEYWLGAVIS